mgnify:FL=1
MKRCTECALLFENSLTHCPQCGRLLVKDKKSPLFFVITVLAITLAILCGVLISFSSNHGCLISKSSDFHPKRETGDCISRIFMI